MRRIGSRRWRWFVVFLAICCLAGVGCDDDDDDNDDDGGDFCGEIVGLIVDRIDGGAVAGATLRALVAADAWVEAQSAADGTFVLAGVPVASSLYVEFAKDGYCPMALMVDTNEAEHSGAITDILVEAIRADADVILVVTAGGEFVAGLTVTMTATSYGNAPTGGATDAAGEVTFDAGMGQSYEFAIPAYDADGDKVNDFAGETIAVDVSMPAETIRVDLAPNGAGGMELMSLGVAGVTAVALFSQWVSDIEIIDAWAEGATLGEPPLNWTASGGQLRLTPVLASGVLVDGAEVGVYLRVRGGSTGEWWTGDLSYEVETDLSGDDDTAPGPSCTDVFLKMYVDCGFCFVDGYENPILLADVIGWCEADESGYGLEGELARCIWHSSCDDMPDCL